MREVREIETDIENLRKKLNAAICKNTDEEGGLNRIPDDDILLMSQEMDKLINEYQEASK